jgi:hypothetical protein
MPRQLPLYKSGPVARRAKTETLSLRLDPKTKFIVDFIARLRGQSITTVVERAIKDAADAEEMQIVSQRGERVIYRRWSEFWDPSEGVRALKLIAESKYPTTFEEDELRQFTMSHWQFFYADATGLQPRRAYVDVLWPHVESVLTHWRETKSTDYWSAGEMMKSILKNARLAPPDNWPPVKRPADDDDIPF